MLRLRDLRGGCSEAKIFAKSHFHPAVNEKMRVLVLKASSGWLPGRRIEGNGPMNSQIRGETAQILQFQPHGRNALKARVLQANAKQPSHDFQVSTSVCGGAWYHEAAIIEAERPHKP
jgi:hypothetical protein